MDELIHWGPEYELGVELIDRQHKQLANMINCLSTAMSYGDARPILGSLVEQLLVAAEQHFRSEKELMEQSQFPERKAHQEEHAQLISKAKKLYSNYAQDKSYSCCEKIHALFRQWLIEHDLISDRRYIPYLA